MKRCCHCHEEKPLSEFRNNKSRKDGKHRQCKACDKAYRESHADEIRQKKKEYRESHREEIRAHKKQYCAENADRLKEKGHARYIENREEIRAKAAIYRESNRDKIHQKHRDYYHRNREKVLAYLQTWRDANREKIRLDGIRYRATHGEAINARRRDYRRRKPWKNTETRRRRRSRERMGEHYTEQQWMDLCATHDHRCLRCGRKIQLVADHIVPLVLGGANTIDNIQPLCIHCNQVKGVRVIDYRVQGIVSVTA